MKVSYMEMNEWDYKTTNKIMNIDFTSIYLMIYNVSWITFTNLTISFLALIYAYTYQHKQLLIPSFSEFSGESMQ